MYKDHKIGVVVPAYNEELLILETLEGMPDFVDSIFVINDCSTDNTLELIKQRQEKDDRVVLINHEKNRGLGQSLIDGYLASADSDVEITAVMAGDNQMYPGDLPKLINKIVVQGYDYVKGNRLLHENIDFMPKYRFFGNAMLTILTKFATGYYSLMDPQCGYTAIKNTALRGIPIEEMTKGYGYNADILNMLNIRGYSVCDVEVRPVYGREQSKIKLWKYIPKTSWLLVRLFVRRLWQRYVVRDFHPLVLFYLFALFNVLFLIIPLIVRFFHMYRIEGHAPRTTMIILVFLLITTFQSILFAIWMDMDYNRKDRRGPFV
ncbi:MAG: glycosyltransferase family 2 protein [Candidatus Latescibacterota bacterium]|nr:MAG: glycosyltransferase family 2 protein [Candidatus Latescibacterota bacterium]